MLSKNLLLTVLAIGGIASSACQSSSGLPDGPELAPGDAGPGDQRALAEAAGDRPRSSPDGGCDPHDFVCGNGTCIDLSLLCDGNDDCGNNIDEDPAVGCASPCTCTLGCCLPDGGCSQGMHDDECGNTGSYCEDCTTLGKLGICRQKSVAGVSTQFCILLKEDGQPCSEGVECLSGDCSKEGLCYHPCAPTGDECGWGTLCCNAAEICHVYGTTSKGVCCTPVGGLVDDCSDCCNQAGVPWSCQPLNVDGGKKYLCAPR